MQAAIELVLFLEFGLVKDVLVDFHDLINVSSSVWEALLHSFEQRLDISCELA